MDYIFQVDYTQNFGSTPLAAGASYDNTRV